MANDVDAVAAKLAKLYEPAEPVQEPTAEPVEETVGKSSVIPSVGQSPGQLTADQQIALAGGSETDAKHRLLAELLQRNHTNP